jgi:general secretion pathway protein D
MRDADTTNRVSVDRYDLIRSSQKDMQPRQSAVIPINDSPVIPPLRSVDQTEQPLAPAPTSPGTQPGTLQRPRPMSGSTEPTPTVPVVVPIIVPAPAAPPPSAPVPAPVPAPSR